MGIKIYYRKILRKSIAFFRGNSNIRRIDIILFLVSVVVLLSVVMYRIFFVASPPKRIDILLSPKFWQVLGDDKTDKLIREFEDQNPDLYIRKIPEILSSMNISDIVIFDDYDLGRMVNDSALTSLDSYIHTDAQEIQWTDHWVVPLVSFVDLFAYNTDILKAANSDRPPKTQREFLSTARAVARLDPSQLGQEVIYPLSLGLNENDPHAFRRDIFSWIWANGEDIFRSDSNEAINPKAVKEIFDFFYELDRNDLLAPQPFKRTGTLGLEEFAKGKIAMMVISSRDINYLKNAANEINYSITSIPAASLGKNRLGISFIYAGINSNCTKTDKAWSFLAFLAENTKVFAQALSAIPGSYPANYPGEYVLKDPLLRKAWEIYEAADIVEYKPEYDIEEAIKETFKEKLTEAIR